MTLTQPPPHSRLPLLKTLFQFQSIPNTLHRLNRLFPLTSLPTVLPINLLSFTSYFTTFPILTTHHHPSLLPRRRSLPPHHLLHSQIGRQRPLRPLLLILYAPLNLGTSGTSLTTPCTVATRPWVLRPPQSLVHFLYDHEHQRLN